MIRFKREDGEHPAHRGKIHALAVLIAVGALGSSGCSISMSLPPFIGDDETGTIKPAHSPLSDQLDLADWRIAQPALAKVLTAGDSQPPVAWTNPGTTHGGLFQSVGLAFTRKGAKCRAFVAGVSGSEEKTILQGIGCLDENGEVQVDGVGPWKGL
jgi:hypothetical protein